METRKVKNKKKQEKQNKTKKTVLNILKFKAIIFIYTHDLQQQNFLIYYLL